MFKIIHRAPLLVAGLLSPIMLITATPTHAAMLSADKFTIYGDFRLRFESDWGYEETQAHHNTVTTKEARNRARIRARIGLTYKPTENYEYGVRLRSGSDESHLSPHITIADFDKNKTGSADFNLDKWFFKSKFDGLWAWVGRNSLPFWKQNEMFWDDDATVLGMAAGYNLDIGTNNTLSLNAGYVTPPAGMHDFTGTLSSGQVVFTTKFGENQITAAVGRLALFSNADTYNQAGVEELQALLWDGNESRDYKIWIASLQGKFKVGLPLTVGIDWMHNTQNYGIDDPDPFTIANRDETDGYVFSIQLGQLKEKNDWLLGYYYAHIETFAVNSSYAQDDWARWDPQSSNMEGHEFRAAYKPINMLSIVARFYMLETIIGTEKQGNRFRVDFNYKF